MEKAEYLHNIENVIRSKSYYVATVLPGPQPGYAYTIGLMDKVGFEYVFCGGGNFSGDDLKLIIDVACKIKADKNFFDQYFEVENCGKFRLQLANESWTKKTMLGVYDFFNTEQIKAYQIIPEEKNKLLDVPDMSEPWDNNDPIWKWLEKEWPYGIPQRSIAITNFMALMGECITELTRWEENEWEMFAGAGPDVEEDIRIVPFATLLGIDPSLEAAIDLEIGKGLWRDSKDHEWTEWGL